MRFARAYCTLHNELTRQRLLNELMSYYNKHPIKLTFKIQTLGGVLMYF